MGTPHKSKSRNRLAALFAVIGHWVLGKSSPDYLKQFTGGDVYVDEAIAANPNYIPVKVENRVPIR